MINRSALILLVAGLVAGSVAGAGAITFFMPAKQATAALPPVGAAAPAASAPAQAATPATLSAVFRQTENSVVQITSKVSEVNSNILINGNPLESQSSRLGSGFVYDNQGHIVTNNHVVDGAQTVDVTFVDGNTYSAKVIGKDAFSDLAVLKITDNVADEHLSPLPIGNSTGLEVGEQVIAIGNPFGLSNTMTSGIVSQVGRLLPNDEAGFSIPNVIQTDAAINPGNSGGPLLNIKGEVVGVNSAIKSSTGDFAGVGFAIPSSTVQKIVPVLIEKGEYNHPWLGIAGASIGPELVQKLSLAKNFKGVLISSTVPDGPAAKAGVQGTIVDRQGNVSKRGDIITAVDGHIVKRIEDVIMYIEEHKSVGDSVTLTLDRGGSQVKVAVELGARPAPG
ncbi:MAG: trypsin-like peptidase domain-containing protein [Nitrososphaera sp.]|jgi:S1-C subfamily serine protease